jgi:hypothetical protein
MPIGGGIYHRKKHDIASSIDHYGNIYDALVNAINPLSAADPAVSKSYVDTAISGHRAPVQVLRLKDDSDQGGAPPAAVAGEAYVVNNWGMGYTDGDIVEYDGAIWNVIVANVGGAPPDLTRAIIDPTPAGSFAGQDDDIAQYNAGTATWLFTSPADGDQCVVIGNGSVYENQTFIYDLVADVWINMGTTIFHNALINLNWSAAGHIIDSDVNFTGWAAAGVKRPLTYWTSQTDGSDTTGDGGITNPFQNIQTAVDLLETAGVAGTIIVDGDSSTPQNVNVGAINYVPIAIFGGGRHISVIGTLTLTDDITLHVADFSIFTIARAGVNNGEVTFTNCNITTIDTTGQTYYRIHNSTISPAQLETAITNGAVVQGEVVGPTNRMVLFGGISDTGEARHFADPTNAQDLATKNYVDTVLTANRSLFDMASGTSMTGNQTGYLSSFGNYVVNTAAETRMQACSLIRFTMNVSTNTLAGASTFELWLNNAATGWIITYGAGATGRQTITNGGVALAVADGDLLTVKAILGGNPAQAIYPKEVSVEVN